MVVAAWCGQGKPTSVQEYFAPFVNEMKPILINKLQINNTLVTVKIYCFVCDTPARSFAKGTVGYMHI